MKGLLRSLSLCISLCVLMAFPGFTASAEEALTAVDSGVKADIRFENGSGDYHNKTVSIDGSNPFGNDQDITVQSIEAHSAGRAGNTPPVAELRYIILNPESYVNGRISTKTQIAWLWSYNGENFTYDPDGDAITDMFIGGIPSDSIIASLDGNIGFVTRFPNAGQYKMTYYVKDARGAVSNMFEILINIEAEGNTRPVCVASYSPSGTVTTTTPVIIDWKNSYDADPGDSITDVRGQVYKDQSYQAANISQYLLGIDAANQRLSLQFRETGAYEVYFSVGDNHGAWSDWTSFTVDVVSSKPSMDIDFSYQEESDIPNNYDAYWLDYDNSLDEYNQTGASAEALLYKLATKAYPAGIPNKRIGPDVSITGTCKNPDGTPMAGATVKIQVPFNLGALGLNAETVTDSNGNFSYTIDGSSAYWKAIGLEIGDREHPLSGTLGTYAHLSDAGTLFITPTVLSITVGNATYREDVVITTGICRYRMVGGWILYPYGWERFTNP